MGGGHTLNRFETRGRKKNNALFNRRLFSKAIYGERLKLPPRSLLIETPLVGLKIVLIGICALSLFLHHLASIKTPSNAASTIQQFNVPPLSRINKPLVTSGRALFSRERNHEAFAAILLIDSDLVLFGHAEFLDGGGGNGKGHLWREST